VSDDFIAMFRLDPEATMLAAIGIGFAAACGLIGAGHRKALERIDQDQELSLRVCDLLLKQWLADAIDGNPTHDQFTAMIRRIAEMTRTRGES
jgi:hypothetical protein